ncbi:hemagglutinin repeat-containing protein, partial [Erwinia sp. Eh17-17]|uniref:hemagglutinin repeat-containing protein n=1 Tax=Erwinia sp. Eh17-17 TaxID=3080330 RepID=UPI00320BA4E2
MNKHCYRLIFSRTHGELRVVSELARSCSSEPGQTNGSGAPRLWVTVRRAVWMLGLSLFAVPALAGGIVADGQAAGQSPQVIATQNGLPQVNITAPNQAGVSHNQYSQFDVDNRGAVLNNSAVMTQTQLAGMIQGNPNLNPDSAPARVILNEVNSNNPSELRGFLEVAGGRAQVIVANPAGIVCNGCGTINAGRMTITTGKPQLNADGSLAGYQVERGTVRIEGGGLNGDARHDTEYVDVLARAVEVNAGVWARQGLNVVAGRNRVSADGKTVTALATDGKTPELAIDMGQMGGMYSGHIRMIGTEAGVGVRNQGGHIQADKTLTVSSEGKLTWQSGRQDAVTQAGGDIRLTARDTIEHHGKLHSGGTLAVESREGELKQSGTLAAAGNVRLQAKRDITSSGNLLAGSDINSKLTQEADLTLTSQGDIRASGSLLSRKDVTLSGQRVDLSQSKLAAHRASIHAQTGGVALQQTRVDGSELAVSTTGAVEARQAQIGVGRWDIDAASLSSQGGVWSQTGEGESRFALSGLLDNTDGSIEVHDLSLSAGALTNQHGRLVALGSTAQRWQVTGLLDNHSGALGSNGGLTLTAGRLDNQKGTLQSQSALNITAKKEINNAGGKLLAGGAMAVGAAGAIDNQSGTLTANGATQIRADSLLNGQGTLQSLDSLDMQFTRALDNSGGRIFSRLTQTLSAGDIFNTQGWMGTQGSWSADGGQFVNRGGSVQSQQGATLTAATLDNQKGTLISGADWMMKVSQNIDNSAGKISALGQLSLRGATAEAASGDLNNAGGQLLAGKALTAAVKSIDNRQSGVISSAERLQLDVKNALDNRQGRLESGDSMQVAAHTLQNTGGMLESQQQLGLNVLTLLNNTDGTVRSNGDQQIAANQVTNSRGVFSSGGGLTLSAQQLDNPDGMLIGQKRGDYHVDTLNNQKGKIHSGGALTLEAGVANNQGGQLVATQALELYATQLNNNDRGQISSQNALTVEADGLNNSSGGLLLGTTQTGVSARTLDNRSGNLQSAGTMTLSLLETLDNRQGHILANKSLTVQNGNPRARSAVTPALNLINQGGVVQSGDALTVQTRTLNNQGGTLLSQGALTLSVQQDYTHRTGDTLSSNGMMTLSVAGVLTNLTDWLLPGSLTLNSQHFTNQGSLVGKTLRLTTGMLINRGRLEADSMTLNVDTLDNPATVIGDDITVRGRLIDNHGSAAVMASTQRLDLRARERLTNRDGALLYSSGSLSLGSDDLIENRASKIEADGDVAVDAGRLDNLREGLEITRNAESSDYNWHRYNYYWRSYGSSVGSDKNTMTPTTQQLTFNDNAAASTSRYGTLLAIDAGAKRAQVRVMNDKGVLTDLWVNYLALKPGADGSYAMTFYETRGFRQETVPTPYQNTVWREHDIGSLEQWDPTRHLDIADAPYVSDYNNLRERTVTGTVTSDRLESAGTGAHILAGGNMVLRVAGQLLNDASTLSANGDLNIAGAKNIVNKGYSVNERRQEYIVDHYDRDTHHWHPTFNRDDTTALTTIDAIMTGNGRVTIQGTDIENVTVGQAQISSVAGAQQAAEAERAEWQRNPLGVNVDGTQPLTPGELALTDKQHLDRVAMSIPNNGLFRQNTAPGSPFLIVTDERFTSRSQFISSDYLLDRVGYDPALVVKRLGDGFYEQRLVREQILALTGRPSVKGEDAMAQYQSLMNNGSKVAQDFHLVPGVAMTPAQIAALEQDVVWLVSETVDSAAGPQTVWVPKVYLANTTLRLSGDGALIAGGDLQLSAGSLSNAGNLVSDQTLKIDADRFLHQGGDIRADSINVQAASLTLSTNLQDALRQASMTASDISLSGTDVKLRGAKLDATQNLSLSAQNSLDIGAARSSHTASLEVISGAMGNRTSAGMEEAGKRMAQVSGEWQQAQGSTLNAGGHLNLSAGQDITLQGSQARAGGNTQVQAGGDVKLQAETTTNTTHLTANSRTSSVSNSRQEDRLLVSTLGGDQGVTVVAGKNLLVEGAQVDSQQGRVGVSAQDVTIKEARQVTIDRDSENKREGKTKSHREVETVRDSGAGSTFSGQKGVTIIARENDITVAGSTLHSEEGAIALQAKQDVLINSATDRESQFSEERSQKKGFLKKSSSHTIKDDRTTREQGTLLSGDSVSVSAGKDLMVQGSSIAADHDVSLQAGHNVDIVAATETDTHYSLEEKKKSGLMGSGGIGFTIGKQSSKHEIDEKGTTQSQSVSTVGSSQGNVSITAGNRAHIGGADLVAGKDLSITGDSVQIDPGYDQRTRKETFESKQSGFTLALSGTVGSALNTAVSTAQQARKEGDGRLQTLQGTKAVLSGAQAAQALNHDNAITDAADAKNAANGLTKNDKGAEKGATNTIGVNLSYGSQSSKSETTTQSSQAQGSTLNAGQNLSITATGKDKGPDSGDITIAGSQLKAGKDLTLDASRDIHLQSAQNTESTNGKNSSKGGSVGVGIGVGSGGWGISVSASVNAGKGHEKGRGLTHDETTLDAGSAVSLTSGRDTTLKGAQVSGETIKADVGRNLSLASEQDSDSYDAKQQNTSAGGSFTFGSMTGSVNVNASRDRMNSDFDSVKEQTGLFAGGGGYDIRVGDHTQLDGAVISSTGAADKNRLDTGTLGWSDIDNQAHYKTEHQSAGFNSGGPVGSNLL